MADNSLEREVAGRALVPVRAESIQHRPWSGEAIEEFASGLLATGNGGEIEVPEAERRLIAVFRNGLAIVAKGNRWSPEVKAVLDRAARIDRAILRIIESDSETILSVYEKFDRTCGAEARVRSEIERQKDLRRIIAEAAQESASDIHFQVHPGYCAIRIRVHGRLRPLENRAAEDGTAIINAAFAVASDQGAETGVSTFMKGSLTRASGLLPPHVDLARLQYSPTSGHRPSLVIRLKHSSRKGDADVRDLGYLPDQVRDIAVMRRRTSGLYLLAGKVSSGKTTTLQCILNTMIREKANEISVFSIEEPVELEISGAVHVAVVPRSGQSRSDAFIEAIKATLRSDPNVVVLGELRDRDLARYAMELAMTGHSLWSTVHAGSSLGILDRMSDFGVEPWKLAEPSIVRGLIYQRLIGVLCPQCKVNFDLGIRMSAVGDALAKEVMRISKRSPDRLFVRGPGCPRCHNGLTGRTVVAETCLPDPVLLDHYARGDRSALRDHWLSPKSEGGTGGTPVMHHAMIKVGSGQCDINEVEEEVDLLSAYKRDFPMHASRLADDIRAAEGVT